MRIGNCKLAQEDLEIALDLNTKMKDDFNLARVQKKMGINEFLMKDYSNAIAHLREALEKFEKNKNTVEIDCLKKLLEEVVKSINEKQDFDILVFIDKNDQTNI